MIDACFRLAYRVAYQGARVYWRLLRPKNHGALVAMWHDGKVLLVQNSYLNYMSLPGGYVRASESAEEAAVRELREEVGLTVEKERLTLALDHEHMWEGRQDHVVIFELSVEEPPSIQIDNREVVRAEWLTPEEALSRNLFPPLRTVVERRAA